MTAVADVTADVASSNSDQLRRPALDGLRGIAALVVVIHHCLLSSPRLAAGYNGGAVPSLRSWSGLLLYSPLHLFWAGGEAVLLFFVLSGLVLTLPYTRGRGLRWRAYYPARLLRLYLPLLPATALAFLLVNAVPRRHGAWSSWWIAVHTSPVGVREAVHNAVLVRGTTWMNSAFWSLRWEVFFSLLLPLLLFATLRARHRKWLQPAVLLVASAMGTLRTRRLPWLQLSALLVASAVGSRSGHQALEYLPVFGLGMVMAARLATLDRWGLAFDGMPVRQRREVFVGVALLLTAQWWLAVLPRPLSRLPYLPQAGLVLVMTGASILVWIYAATAAGRRVGTSRAPRWLGRRSYSLYLVHEPIVVTVAYLLRGTGGPLLLLAVSLPLALAVAEAFGRWVEQPSHRLSRAVGRMLSRPPLG